MLLAWGGLALSGAVLADDRPCAKTDFEQVVEEAAGTLRDLNNKNRPEFQDKLRQLKTKRGWSQDQFLQEAKPLVQDEKIATFDQRSDELLATINNMGEAGAAAKKPDCALLLELRARMKVLVDTQTQKWAYMFDKIDAELWK